MVMNIEKIRKAVLEKLNAVFIYNYVKKIGWKITRTVFILGFCYAILYPLLISVSKSFMPLSDTYDNTVLLIPKNFTLSNYIGVAYVMDYFKSLGNSMILSVGVTILQTFTCLLVGYGFARFNFKFKNLLFGLVIFTIIVPPQILTIPMFLHFRFFDLFGIFKLITGKPGVNLLDTYFPYFLLGFFGQGIRNGLFIFIFRQFFKGMPKETEEAALVDGAGYFKIFYRIMLPNAITSAITVALFSFVWQYNDISYATTFLPNTKIISMAYDSLEQARAMLLNVGFSELYNPQQLGLLKSAAVILILIPVVLIYTVTQRFFVNSVERAGIVG
jgi:multiple sugar transport system permease protein